MSDLTSRADTIKALRAYADQKGANGEIELANGILKAVCYIEEEENIPTAYDVEKVVEQICGCDGCSGCCNCHEEQRMMECEEYLRVHDIVRAGGKE